MQAICLKLRSNYDPLCGLCAFHTLNVSDLGSPVHQQLVQEAYDLKSGCLSGALHQFTNVSVDGHWTGGVGLESPIMERRTTSETLMG